MLHSVYFWLKPEYQNDEDRAKFEAGLESLFGIPQIQSGGWGKPAGTAPRPVLDSSYSYGLYQVFDSVADHDLYQENELHTTFIATFKDWWEKVLVTDVE